MDPLVVVTWRDAHFELDDPTPPEDNLVRTVGWMLSEGPTFLTVAAETTSFVGHRATTHIPLALIVDVAHLEIAPRTYDPEESWGVTA